LTWRGNGGVKEFVGWGGWWVKASAKKNNQYNGRSGEKPGKKRWELLGEGFRTLGKKEKKKPRRIPTGAGEGIRGGGAKKGGRPENNQKARELKSNKT